MLLSNKQLHILGQCAVSACYQAGKLVERYARQKKWVVKHKDIGSSLAAKVVTEVDILSQTAILNVLEPTCAEFDLALLTEEQVDDNSRFEKEYFWCIDPLDGTLPFTEGNPGFAISVALVAKNGEPVIGVVFDPTAQTLYYAVKGQGALRNGVPWELEDRGRRKRLGLFADRSFVEHIRFIEISAKIRESIRSIGFEGFDLFITAGAVMNACYVLDKLPACYLKFPKVQEGGGSVWDFAATACIFNELGVPATTIRGETLPLNLTHSTFLNEYGVLFASDLDIARVMQAIYLDIESL